MKQIITLLAIVITSTYGFGQIPTTNLVAYYPFNGNTVDETPNFNDATIFGATLTTDRFGNQNSAYDFDGVDDYLSIAHDNSISFDGFSESYSFSYWVNSATPKLADPAFRLFEKRITGLNDEKYPVIIGGVAGTNDYSSQYVVYDGTPPSTNVTTPGAEWDGNWHHMTFIVDNANWEMRIYIDAVLAASTPLDLSSSTANTADLLIGTNYQLLNFYHGALDDIRLYEDVLTECEIFALYIEDMPNLHTTENVAVCEGDNIIFPDGNQINNLVADTVYTSYFPSTVNGCDSASIETSVVVTLVDETITLGGLGMTLNSNVSSGAAYQWVDCDNDMSNIVGANSQSYTSVVNGNFALIITQSGCVDTSECMAINSASIEELLNSINVYPNPSYDLINIETSENMIGKNYMVTDYTGKIIHQARITSTIEIFRMKSYGAGMYFVQVEGTAVRKRIVIQ